MHNHRPPEQTASPPPGLGFHIAGEDEFGEHPRKLGSGNRSALLEGKRILIVEDEAMLAFTLSDELDELGCKTVGPFTTLGEAMQAVRDLEFDAAIVDVNLAGQFVYPLADDLIARGVPFVFLTGYARSTLPDRLQGCPHLLKPYSLVLLERELIRAMKGH